MSHEHDLSHRQEREHKKQEHAHSTPGKHTPTKRLTFGLVIAILFIGMAVLLWTFVILPMRATG